MTQEEVIRDLKQRYHSSQDYKEIAWFWEAANKLSPKVIVEIGVFAGGTLKILSTLVTDRTGLVIGMDYDWHNWEPNKWDLNEGMCPIKLIDGNSHEERTLMKLQKELNGRQIDVLFIDGDHSYEGCDMDYKMYSPLVRKGGIIGVHDLNMKRQASESPKVKKCGEWWDELPQPKYSYFSPLHDNTGYGIGYIIKGEGQL